MSGLQGPRLTSVESQHPGEILELDGFVQNCDIVAQEQETACNRHFELTEIKKILFLR